MLVIIARHAIARTVKDISRQTAARSLSSLVFRSHSYAKHRKTTAISSVFIIAATLSCCAIEYFPRDSRLILRNDGDNNYAADSAQVVRVIDKHDNLRQHTDQELPIKKNNISIPKWSEVGDHLRDVFVPKWALPLPGYIEKLQDELSFRPGSLSNEIWQDAHDPEVNPEILADASVRISTDLCDDELTFLKKRKSMTRKALARYLDLDDADVHASDVPTIAMCGSGGGLRALVAGASSYCSAQEAGLFDCVTYTAGVSGSCWWQTLYYSTLTGQRHDKLLQHLKDRLNVHIAFPPPLLNLLTSAPTNKYLLCGPVEKYHGVENADFGIVDVYGLLLGARLLVPRGELRVNAFDLKISHQKQYVSDGLHPLPIYTAVRHEIPPEQENERTNEHAIDKAKREAWFQWFEFTPFEFWCEEWEAGIPVWAVGRNFQNGRTIWRDNGLCLPEIRVPLLMGVFGSAFCATLSHYYKEVRPLIHGLLGFGDLDDALKEHDDDLAKVHPVAPAQVPNYALGMSDQLPKICPPSVYSSPTIQLMDAGMSNNLPIYPLLRPGRDVDIIITFDASADVRQDNWLRVADGYAKKRGIKGWPLGLGWPGMDGDVQKQTEESLDRADQIDGSKGDLKRDAQDSTPRALDSHESAKVTQLGRCTVWVGMKTEDDSTHVTSARPVTDSMDQVNASNAGIAVVYFPLLPNSKVEGVDPMSSDFLSTWNFIYTPEQVDKVVSLAKANFEEGADMTKKCVRAVYERKKRARLEQEAKDGPIGSTANSDGNDM